MRLRAKTKKETRKTQTPAEDLEAQLREKLEAAWGTRDLGFSVEVVRSCRSGFPP